MLIAQVHTRDVDVPDQAQLLVVIALILRTASSAILSARFDSDCLDLRSATVGPFANPDRLPPLIDSFVNTIKHGLESFDSRSCM